MVANLLFEQKTTWVIVADEAAATVYERKTRRGPLTELFQLSNEAARKKTGELLADRGGRSFNSHGYGRHTMTKEVRPKRHAAQVFAKTLAQQITSGVHDGRCDEIALVAAPRFLGMMRDALTKAGGIVPALSIDKEMVGKDSAAIEKLLEAYS